MKALLKKASKWDYYQIIEIDNLFDLLNIYDSLIIESDKEILDIYRDSDNPKYDNDFEIVITIYDDYVE